MPRSMDSILATDEPSEIRRQPLPETVEREARQAPDSGATPDRQERAEQQSAKATTAKADAGDDDDDDELGSDPTIPEGVRKALRASRKGEREGKKRTRELERLLAETNGRLAQLSQQSAAPQQPATPVVPKDEDLEFLQKPVGWVRDQFGNFKQEFSGVVEQERVARKRERIEDQIESFQEKHEDAKEHHDFFFAAAKTAAENGDFTLTQIVTAIADGKHPQYRNVAKFAYDWAKNQKRLDGATNLDEYDAKVEARIRAKVLAELGMQPTEGDGEERQRPAAKTPKSLATARGSGVGTGGAPRPRSTSQVFDE